MNWKKKLSSKLAEGNNKDQSRNRDKKKKKWRKNIKTESYFKK